MAWTDINGELIPAGDARISCDDTGFLYGLAVYETLLVIDGAPIFFSEHMQRLYQALEFFQFPVAERAQLADLLRERLLRLTRENGYMVSRVRITYSPGELISFANLGFKEATIILREEKTADHWPRNRDWHSFENKFTSRAPYKKFSRPDLPAYVKITSNYPNIISALQARKNGFQEAILVNEDGFVTEGSFCNLFWLKGRTFYTPALSNNLLEGITRKKIISLIKKRKAGKAYLLQEGNYPLQHLLQSDFVFLSSSIRGVLPVTHIDQTSFSPEPPPAFSDLNTAYEDLVWRDRQNFARRYPEHFPEGGK